MKVKYVKPLFINQIKRMNLINKDPFLFMIMNRLKKRQTFFWSEKKVSTEKKDKLTKFIILLLQMNFNKFTLTLKSNEVPFEWMLLQ